MILVFAVVLLVLATSAVAGRGGHPGDGRSSVTPPPHKHGHCHKKKHHHPPCKHDHKKGDRGEHGGAQDEGRSDD
ncbi:MAG: hypothetical protein EXQ81_03145 [Thermoleophilia bacterium]|nr:hypothetical protein [Thermoleophilia bacterium]